MQCCRRNNVIVYYIATMRGILHEFEFIMLLPKRDTDTSEYRPICMGLEVI
jgi:hypothetical protein